MGLQFWIYFSAILLIEIAIVTPVWRYYNKPSRRRRREERRIRRLRDEAYAKQMEQKHRDR